MHQVQETYTFVHYDDFFFLVPDSEITPRYRAWMKYANYVGTPLDASFCTVDNAITVTESKQMPLPDRIKTDGATIVADDEFRYVAPSEEVARRRINRLDKASALFETLPYDGTWDKSLDFKHTGKFVHHRKPADSGALANPVAITHMYEWKFNI